MLFSITHRLTGVALSLGTVLVVWWLAALAVGPDYFATVHGIMGSWFGRLLIFGWTWAAFYHLCNGVRHLFWDMGRGFELATARNSGLAALAASVILTLVAWSLAYALRGG